MKRAFDSASVRQTLQHGIEKGYWHLEHLDAPPASYDLLIREAKKSRLFGPDFYPDKPYVNLLRKATTVEVVSTDPGHEHLAEVASANEGSSDLDLHPQRWPDQPHVPDLSDRRDLSSDQDAPAAGADHGQAPHLGKTRQHHTPGAGALRQPSLEPGEYLDDPCEPDF